MTGYNFGFQLIWSLHWFEIYCLDVKRIPVLINTMPKDFKSLNDYKSIAISFGVTLIGVVLLILPQLIPEIKEWPIALAIFTNLGALLVASLSLSIIWELTIKRSFLNEIYEVSKVSIEVKESGLTGISMVFHQQDWGNYFKNVKHFDFFVTYAKTWRNSNKHFMDELAKRADAKIRVVLPNPDNLQLITELARRCNKTESNMKSVIEESIKDYNYIFSGKECQYAIYLTDRAPLFCIYRFDHQILASLFTQMKDIQLVPMLKMDTLGSVSRFFIREFDDLIATAVAEKK